MMKGTWEEFIAAIDRVCCDYQHSLTDIRLWSETVAERHGLPRQVGPLALDTSAHWHNSGYCGCGGAYDDCHGLAVSDISYCETCRKAEEALAELRRKTAELDPKPSTLTGVMKLMYDETRLATMAAESQLMRSLYGDRPARGSVEGLSYVYPVRYGETEVKKS